MKNKRSNVKKEMQKFLRYLYEDTTENTSTLSPNYSPYDDIIGNTSALSPNLTIPPGVTGNTSALSPNLTIPPGVDPETNEISIPTAPAEKSNAIQSFIDALYHGAKIKPTDAPVGKPNNTQPSNPSGVDPEVNPTLISHAFEKNNKQPSNPPGVDANKNNTQSLIPLILGFNNTETNQTPIHAPVGKPNNKEVPSFANVLKSIGSKYAEFIKSLPIYVTSDVQKELVKLPGLSSAREGSIVNLSSSDTEELMGKLNLQVAPTSPEFRKMKGSDAEYVLATNPNAVSIKSYQDLDTYTPSTPAKPTGTTDATSAKPAVTPGTPGTPGTPDASAKPTPNKFSNYLKAAENWSKSHQGSLIGAGAGAGITAAGWAAARAYLQRQLKNCETEKCKKDIKAKISKLNKLALLGGIGLTVLGAAAQPLGTAVVQGVKNIHAKK